jgi:hypothetical protein
VYVRSGVGSTGLSVRRGQLGEQSVGINNTRAQNSHYEVSPGPWWVVSGQRTTNSELVWSWHLHWLDGASLGKCPSRAHDACTRTATAAPTRSQLKHKDAETKCGVLAMFARYFPDGMPNKSALCCGKLGSFGYSNDASCG